MTRALVLFGHGSRDPLWREPMDALAGRLRARLPQAHVTCAFLELQAPDLPTAVQDLAKAGAEQVTIVPVFFGVGRHAREDLPRLVTELRDRHPALDLAVTPAVGEWTEVLDGLAEAVLKRT